MPGLTAYTGLLNIGRPQPGETLMVAAASGAVGSVVGQIAKIKGCRAIGIAGGEKKCRYVKEELGFDDCLDHHQPGLAERLKGACPSGIAHGMLYFHCRPRSRHFIGTGDPLSKKRSAIGSLTDEQ